MKYPKAVYKYKLHVEWFFHALNINTALFSYAALSRVCQQRKTKNFIHYRKNREAVLTKNFTCDFINMILWIVSIERNPSTAINQTPWMMSTEYTVCFADCTGIFSSYSTRIKWFFEVGLQKLLSCLKFRKKERNLKSGQKCSQIYQSIENLKDW